MPDGSRLSQQTELFEFTQEELALAPQMAQSLTPEFVAAQQSGKMESGEAVAAAAEGSSAQSVEK